ncbi:MAG: GC-type dockerin domain-anchored protein [Phycisphaerales bacterium]
MLPRPAAAQCGPSFTGHFGGETNAVAQVNANTLVVARGTELEMFSLASSSAPAPYSPRRRIALDAPAVKIAYTQGSSRGFVLLQNGDVQVFTVAASQFVNTGLPSTINTDYAIDIVADGTRVYIVILDEHVFAPELNFTEIWAYELSSGTPQFLWQRAPLTSNYVFDRVAMVSNVLWAAFHENQSQILGIQGFNVTNAAAPVPTGAALTNAPLGAYTARVGAMTAIGNKLLVSYRHAQGSSEEGMRAANVSVATNPTWNAEVDLNGEASCMSSIGNQLRIAIENSGVGTWDTINPASLVWLGAYFDSFPQVWQMVCVPSTDYWAAGPAGLMTMNTTNPAASTTRSTPVVPLPTRPTVVRQRGNTSVVLDYTLNALRLFDYTLPEAQQLRSSHPLPFYSELVELGELAGGTIGLACVASQGNPGGDVIAIIDITNPAAPVTRSTITGVRAHLMSVSGSRLYVFTTNNDFKIYELAVPTSPQHRSSTHYGGNNSDFTCLTSWSNNAAALGTTPFGLWLLDTTNAEVPFVASIWNPVSGYRVNSMVKSPNYLYVSASVGATPFQISDTRLELLVVTNMTNPTQRFADTSTTGAGSLGAFSSLTYVSNATAKFLVGVKGRAHDLNVTGDDTQSNSVTIFQLFSFFFVENVPTPIAVLPIPLGHGNAAVNADGSRVLIAGDAAGLYQIAMPVQWAPGFGVRPFDQRFCNNTSSVTIVALAPGNPTNVTTQWYRDGVALVDGPTPWGSTISGSTDIGITITRPRPEDAMSGPFSPRRYVCAATNSCGTTFSAPAILVAGCPNKADVARLGGAFGCDEQLSADDIVVFLTAFFANDLTIADIVGLGGNPTPDGTITTDDLIAFLAAYFAGCQ